MRAFFFFLLVELLETPRWTEEEMEIAKQGNSFGHLRNVAQYVKIVLSNLECLFVQWIGNTDTGS